MAKITEDRATMNFAAFKDLPEYSTTLPTGTTVGKRWRRLHRDEWFLGEYIENPNPKVVSIKWREIWILFKDHDARATENQIKSLDSQERLVGSVIE